MWPLTFVSLSLSGKGPENLGSEEKSLDGVPGREGIFLVSPLFSLGFSRYDPVVGPGGLELGEGRFLSVFLRDS